MGVYIPNMEMPKSCSECRFFVDAWCYAFKADDWRNAYNKPPNGERLDNCPLAPVPPHGRLIDADAFIKENEYFADRDFNNPRYDTTLRELVGTAPTIVPAEEGE